MSTAPTAPWSCILLDLDGTIADSAPGIIGSLPPVVMLLVTLTAPAYMMLMFTDMRGQAMLLAGVTWMGMGVFVMKKMIAFKF